MELLSCDVYLRAVAFLFVKEVGEWMWNGLYTGPLLPRYKSDEAQPLLLPLIVVL